MARRDRLKAADVKFRQRARVVQQKERDEGAHNLAQSVYVEAVEWKAQGGPMQLAGVTVAARLTAPQLLVSMDAALTAENADAVAAYLVHQFIEAANVITPGAVGALAEERRIPWEP